MATRYGPIPLRLLVQVGTAEPNELAAGSLEFPPNVRQTLPEMLRQLADDIEALPR